MTMPKPLTTWIPDELAEKFEHYCNKEGHCKSDMLRKIVLKWLDDKMKDGVEILITSHKESESEEENDDSEEW